MAKRLFISGNFIEIDEDNGQDNLQYLKTSTTYRKFTDHWLLESSLKGIPDFIISFGQAVLYFDEAGTTAYDQTTLEAFLDLNAKGGSGYLRSDTTGEPTGSEILEGNVVVISQANYDAAESANTVVLTTWYIING